MQQFPFPASLTRCCGLPGRPVFMEQPAGSFNVFGIFIHTFVHHCLPKMYLLAPPRNINDPEHPLTLEQLNVVELAKVDVDDKKNKVCIVDEQAKGTLY